LSSRSISWREHATSCSTNDPVVGTNRLLIGSAEYGDLVAQDEQLGML
jgi:hypothetical protein